MPASLRTSFGIAAASRAFASVSADLCRVLAFAAAYFLAARLGLALQAQPDGIAVFWPASGLAAGALVWLGPRARMPVAAGVVMATLAANLLEGRDLALAAVFGLCNAGEALLFAWILGRARPEPQLAGLEPVLRFFAGAATSTAAMAALAAIAIRLAKGPDIVLIDVWQAWWLSDLMGIIVFAPFMMMLGETLRDLPSRRELAEGSAVLCVLVLMAALIYVAPRAVSERWIPAPVALVFPILLWAAARCRPISLATGLVLVGLIVVWTTASGIGRLGSADVALPDRVYAARLSLASIAFTSLAFVAVFGERRATEAVLRESEARFRNVFEHVATGISISDLGGRLERCNPAYCRLLGYTESECRGLPFTDLVHPDDVAANLQQVRRLRGGETQSFEIENRYRHKDGGAVWVHKFVSLVPDEAGRPAHILTLVTDMTDRRQAQAMLAQANQALEARVAERTRQLEHEMRLREETQAALMQSQRMEALGQLTGGMAHDFNNLLGVIGGNLELAQAGISDPTAVGYVRKAVDAVQTGASLNRRLLSFSRRRALAPVRVVLNARITEVLPLLEHTLGEHIALRVALDPRLSPAEVDPGEVDNAIVNLALNARDAMPGGGELTITTRDVVLDAEEAARHAGARPGRFVALTVADNGVGMPPEVLARAAEPFFTTKEVGKGTGLGLSTVFGFCRQSAGFMALASAPGQGTAVTIHLPAAEHQPAAGSSSSAAELPTGDGELVLVVEDNDQMRSVGMGQLEALGYTVVEARDGPEAIEMLGAEPQVALVFSDVVMPGGMSGYDLARWVRRNHPAARVVLTSGYDQVAQIERDAAFTVLPKPYTRERLARTIRAALASPPSQGGATSPVKI